MLLPLTFLPIITLTSAHFLLDYPIVRGLDESTLGTFPCGGQSSISPNRTAVSLNVLPVALTMGHDQTVIQILLGLGNDVGDSFNIVLEPTFGQVGLGKFCLPSVLIPIDLNITEGMNATLQVVTDGEGGGGLYNCADITFTSMAEMIPSTCNNGTGVSASLLPSAEARLNANESTATGGAASGESSASSSAGGMTASATASATSGANILIAASGTMGVMVFGVAALLQMVGYESL